jgi:hypothetical protein
MDGILKKVLLKLKSLRIKDGEIILSGSHNL